MSTIDLQTSGATDLFQKPKKMTKHNTKDWRLELPRMDAMLTKLKNYGAWGDMVKYRTTKEILRQKVDAPFLGDITLNSNTKKTKLLKSYIIKTIASIYERTMRLPVFDIEPVSKAMPSVEDKTNASIVNALLEWFIRKSGFETVYKEGLFEFAAYGDSYRRPFFSGKFPGYEDIEAENFMIDPNAKYLNSEAASARAQYCAYTKIYAEENLIDRFGPWITDYAAPGTILDDLSTFDTRSQTNWYEVIEIQDRASKEEYVIVGSNCFPVLMRVQDEKMPKAPHEKALWSSKYIYKDIDDKGILTTGNMYFYLNTQSQYNRGLAHELSPVQNYHEMLLNLTADNVRQRMRAMKYIIGGNQTKIEEQQFEYYKELENNIDTLLKIPASMNATNKPELGVLSVAGIPTQEALAEIQNAMDISKNMTGVTPQQQEIMKDAGLGQTEMMQEKAIEAIEAIADKNLPQFIHEINMMLTFMIAHEGFGLDDVKINFTKYTDEFQEGIPSATISIPGAVKKIKDYHYDVIIDKSSIIKRSNAIDGERDLKFLQMIDPQALPEWFDAIARRMAKRDGVDLPAVKKEQIQQSSAQGGVSQFQDAAGQQPLPPQNAQPI